MPTEVNKLREKLIEERRAIEARISARDRDILDMVPDEDGAAEDGVDGILSGDLDVRRLHQVNKALAELER